MQIVQLLLRRPSKISIIVVMLLAKHSEILKWALFQVQFHHLAGCLEQMLSHAMLQRRQKLLHFLRLLLFVLRAFFFLTLPIEFVLVQLSVHLSDLVVKSHNITVSEATEEAIKLLARSSMLFDFGTEPSDSLLNVICILVNLQLEVLHLSGVVGRPLSHVG